MSKMNKEELSKLKGLISKILTTTEKTELGQAQGEQINYYSGGIQNLDTVVHTVYLESNIFAGGSVLLTLIPNGIINITNIPLSGIQIKDGTISSGIYVVLTASGFNPDDMKLPPGILIQS